MLRRRRFLCSAAVLLAPSVAAGQGRPETLVSDSAIRVAATRVDSVFDRFTGLHLVVVHAPPLAGGSRFEPLTLQFGYGVAEGGKTPLVHMRVRYLAKDWAFLTGELQLVVDGQRMRVLGPGSQDSRETDGCETAATCGIAEAMVIPVPDSVLRALARAHSVEIRAVGARQSLERWFTPEHLAASRYMAQRHLKLAPQR